MGDRTTLEKTLRVYKNGSHVASIAMQRQMQRSSHPAIIPLVVTDVFRDEAARMTTITSEFFDYPLSVRSAEVVRNVLVNSPEFRDEVRQWASAFGLRNAKRMRAAIREWWALNKDHFERQDYMAVNPGSKPTEVIGADGATP
jgi:hypothetical protein